MGATSRNSKAVAQAEAVTDGDGGGRVDGDIIVDCCCDLGEDRRGCEVDCLASGQKMLLGVLDISLEQRALVQSCGCGEVRARGRGVEGGRAGDGLGRSCPRREPPTSDCHGRGGPGLERRVRMRMRTRAVVLGNWRGRCCGTEQEVGRGRHRCRLCGRLMTASCGWRWSLSGREGSWRREEDAPSAAWGVDPTRLGRVAMQDGRSQGWGGASCMTDRRRRR